jgi:hypothetical protein
MQVCPSCSNVLSERGSHCPSCGVQARCKACQGILDLGARFCVDCGTSVGEGAVSAVHRNGENGVSASSSPYNLIRFHQDNRGCDLDAKLTDRAFEAGGEVLSLVIAARAGVQVKRHRHAPSADLVIDDPQLVLPGIVTDNGDDGAQEAQEASEVQPRKAIPAGTDAETLKLIFRFDSDKVKLINTELKATKQEDFIGRLSVLFLYAHELEGRESIARSCLNEVLEDVKVYGGTAKSYIANSKDLVRDKGKVALSVPGRMRAVQVLKEFRDPAVKTDWSLESSRKGARSTKGGAKAGKGSEADKPAKGHRARGNSYTAQITKLYKENFFAKKRTTEAVHAELENRRFTFPLYRINEALTAMTRSGKLYSTKNEAGERAFQNKQVK